MAIERYFENQRKSDVVFDPIPSYSGYWFFGIENLLKNSKKDDKTNLFSEYYNRSLTIPLQNALKSASVFKFPIRFMSQPNTDNIGRKLTFSKVDFFSGITSLLDYEIDKYGKSKEEHEEFIHSLAHSIEEPNNSLNAVYANALGEKLRKLKDLIDKEFNSDYFDSAMKDYEPYKNRISFSDYLKKMYKLIQDCEQGILSLGDFFDTSLNGEDIYNCFDPDTFYLLFATIILEQNLKLDQLGKPLDNNYIYLYQYFEACDEIIKEDKKYNPTILYEWSSGKKERISRRELQIRFEELKKRHPDDTPIVLPFMEDDDVYKNIYLVEKLVELSKQDSKVNWSFLPQGKGITRSERKMGNMAKESAEESLLEETDMRIEIMENSGYVGTPLQGADSFNGYYAFVYSNGVVVLEKFWENEETKRPARECATYVMDIDNFSEMSKVSKIDLITYMHENPNLKVKRIFHTTINNWQRNLYQAINGTSYRIDDAINFIDNLKGDRVNGQ